MLCHSEPAEASLGYDVEYQLALSTIRKNQRRGSARNVMGSSAARDDSGVASVQPHVLVSVAR